MINTNYRTPYFQAYRLNKSQKLSFSGIKEDYAENERKTLALSEDLKTLSKKEKLCPENTQKAINKYTDNMVVKDMDELSWEEKEMFKGYDALAMYHPGDKTELLVNFSDNANFPKKFLIPIISHEFFHGLQYQSPEYQEIHNKTEGPVGLIFSAIEQIFIYPAMNINTQKNNCFEDPNFDVMKAEINRTFALYDTDKKSSLEYFKMRSTLDEQTYKAQSKIMEHSPEIFSRDEIARVQNASKVYSDFGRFVDKTF